jgi:elongation factor Ts
MSNELALIKQLREAVGAGIGDCKKALAETGGNIEEAITWLRKKGIASAAKKVGRVASEGLVGIKIGTNCGIVLELNSETDFVAKNENFRNLITNILNVSLDAKTLEDLNSMKIGGQSVEEKVAESSGLIGEKIVLRRFERVDVKNGVIASYVHGSEYENTGKTCVILGVESDSQNKEALLDLGKKMCMQAAAMRPKYLHSKDVPTSVLDLEKSIAREQLLASKKPESVIEKILEGKVAKYYEDNVLLHQIFVMDNKKTILELVKEYEKQTGSAITFTGLAVFKLGDGIEKPAENFADEVAAMAGEK